MKNNTTSLFRLLIIALFNMCTHNTHGMQLKTSRDYNAPTKIEIDGRNITEGIGHHLTRNPYHPEDLLRDKAVKVLHTYGDAQDIYTVADVKILSTSAPMATGPMASIYSKLSYYDYVVTLLKKTDFRLRKNYDFPPDTIGQDRRERVICVFNAGVREPSPGYGNYLTETQRIGTPITLDLRNRFTAAGIGKPLEIRQSSFPDKRVFTYENQFDVFDGDALEKNDTVIIGDTKLKSSHDKAKTYTVKHDSNRSESVAAVGNNNPDVREIVLLGTPQEKVIKQEWLHTEIETIQEQLTLLQFRTPKNDSELHENSESTTEIASRTPSTRPTALKQGLVFTGIAATVAAVWYMYSRLKS